MKKIFLFIFISCLACYFCLSVFALDVPTDTLTFVGADYNGGEDYFNNFSSVGASVPDGYILAGVLVQPHAFSNGHTSARYYYLPSSATSFTFYVNSSGFAVVNHAPNSDNFYTVRNRFEPNFTQNYVSSSSGFTGGVTTNNSNWIFYSFLDVYDQNGNETPVPSHIPFDLNTLLIDHNLYFNASTTSELATLTNGVDFYVFPSSFPVTSTPVTVYSDVNALTVPADDAYFQQRHFSSILANIDKALSDNVTHIHTILNASYTTSSPLTYFNPDSYNLSYEYLGKWLLFTTGSPLASDARSFKYIDLKSVSRTGVWSNSSLCIVATWRHDGLYSVARWDFNIDTILNQTAVVPSGVTHFTPPPSSGTVSDLQGLADYINDLAGNRVENDNIFLNNLLAGLNTMPWANFIAGGINNAIPNLSFMLDSLFEDLFDKYTAPSDDDINALLADLNAERTSLRAKLAFVDDVKTEYYFVISTITADDNSVPPDFEFALPSMWSGGETIKVKLVTYQIATPEIMSNIKQILTVFLSLGLMLHIWRTLPATVGNMPRGDD